MKGNLVFVFCMMLGGLGISQHQFIERAIALPTLDDVKGISASSSGLVIAVTPFAIHAIDSKDNRIYSYDNMPLEQISYGAADLVVLDDSTIVLSDLSNIHMYRYDGDEFIHIYSHNVNQDIEFNRIYLETGILYGMTRDQQLLVFSISHNGMSEITSIADFFYDEIFTYPDSTIVGVRKGGVYSNGSMEKYQLSGDELNLVASIECAQEGRSFIQNNSGDILYHADNSVYLFGVEENILTLQYSHQANNYFPFSFINDSLLFMAYGDRVALANISSDSLYIASNLVDLMTVPRILSMGPITNNRVYSYRYLSNEIYSLQFNSDSLFQLSRSDLSYYNSIYHVDNNTSIAITDCTVVLMDVSDPYDMELLNFYIEHPILSATHITEGTSDKLYMISEAGNVLVYNREDDHLKLIASKDLEATQGNVEELTILNNGDVIVFIGLYGNACEVRYYQAADSLFQLSWAENRSPAWFSSLQYADSILFTSNYNGSLVSAYSLDTDSLALMDSYEGAIGFAKILGAYDGKLLLGGVGGYKWVAFYSGEFQDESIPYTSNYHTTSLAIHSDGTIIHGFHGGIQSFSFSDSTFSENAIILDSPPFGSSFASLSSEGAVIVAKGSSNGGIYLYDYWGYLEIEHSAQVLPVSTLIAQNYPNPFNPSTTIRYGLPEDASVSLVIYDVRGQVVQTLESNQQSAGWYDITWNGETAEGHTISTGIYFARLVAGEYSQVIKMLYLK